MTLPFHPVIVHFPIALSFILPFLTFIFIYFIKTDRMKPSAWMIIAGLQLFTVASGYLALETGEREEKVVEKVVQKSFISEHEKYAEIFVGVTVLAAVVSVAAYFLAGSIQLYAQLANVIILIVAAFFAYETGEHGGDIIYKHNGARIYQLNMVDDVKMNLLPTPEENTSESSFPVNEEQNESLKVDDNDYGNEDGEVEDASDNLED